jgi:hypothetical protein
VFCEIESNFKSVQFFFDTPCILFACDENFRLGTDLCSDIFRRFPIVYLVKFSGLTGFMEAYVCHRVASHFAGKCSLYIYS